MLIPGPRFNIKTSSYQYRKFHCGDKTILRPLISTMEFPILVRRHLYIESGPWLSAVTYIALMNNWVPFTLSDRKPQWRKSVHLTIIPWAMLSENCHITDLLVIEFRWSVRLFNGDEFSVDSLLSGVEFITLINDWVQFTLSYPKLQSRNSVHLKENTVGYVI